MDSFEAGDVRFDVESSRDDARGFWVVVWDDGLPEGWPVEECVRTISAATDGARQRFPGRGGVVRVHHARAD